MGFDPVTYAAWRQRVEQQLGGADFARTLTSRTPEGIAVEPLYAGAVLPEVGAPGGAPFVRGRATEPVCCPLIRHPELDRAKDALRADQRGGASGAWLDFEKLPARTVGLLSELLSGSSPSLLLVDAGTDALQAAAVLEAAFDELPTTVWLGADPLATLASAGMVPATLSSLEEELVELVAHMDATKGEHRAVLVSSVPHHLAGATAVHELSYALATAAHYLRVAERRGLALDSMARRMTLRFAVGTDVFSEIAKLRAARGLLQHLFATCGVAGADVAIHAVTSSRAMTRRDPWVNMLRATAGAFAAQAGGADALTVLPYDAPLGVPSDLGRRVARNTLTIMREESHLGWVHDPAGGSWYVEQLTDTLAAGGWAGLQRIEGAGGMARHLTSGALKAEIEAVWNARREAIATRKLPLTGVSEFANLEEEPLMRPAWSMATVDDSPAGAAIDDFAAARAAAARGASITALGRAANRGEPTTVPRLVPHRDAEELEALRDAADQVAARERRPTVFLACLGPAAEHKARAEFAFGFFAAGGIVASAHPGTSEAAPSEAAAILRQGFSESGAMVACLCGSDPYYASHAIDAVGALVAAGAKSVIYAGMPGQAEGRLRAAGVEGFIYRGQNIPGVLAPLLRLHGARFHPLPSEEQV